MTWSWIVWAPAILRKLSYATRGVKAGSIYHTQWNATWLWRYRWVLRWKQRPGRVTRQGLTLPSQISSKLSEGRVCKKDPGLCLSTVFLEGLVPSLQELTIYAFFSETIVAASDIEKDNLMFCQSSEIIKTISLMSLL